MSVTRALPLVVALLATTGCDFASLFGGDADDAPSRPSRSRDDEEDDDDDEEPAEGEGEGEGEQPVTDEDIAHPQGPHIISFTSSTSTLDDGGAATLTIVVSDPDGTADIVGALLVDPASDTVLRPLTPSGTPGTFTAVVGWDDLDGSPIEFDFGASSRRQIRVRFFDAAEHTVSQSLPLTLTCGERSACDGRCGSFRCNAQGGCIDVGTDILSDDDICSGCNVGCDACSDGCACFADNDVCTGSAACLGNFAIDDSNDVVIVGNTCEVIEPVRLRADGIIAWRIGGQDRAVTLEIAVSGQSFTDTEMFELLCAGAGVESSEAVDVPADLANAGPVIGFLTPCAPTSLAQVSTCDPLIGDSDLVQPGQAIRLTCLGATEDPEDPIEEPDDGIDSDGDVRLVGGTDSSGRVEVFFNGAWGTVCDDGFEAVDAEVVCRQLGYLAGDMTSSFGGGSESQSIWLDDVTCSGGEEGLAECVTPGVGVHNCGHGEDVGVFCN